MNFNQITENYSKLKSPLTDFPLLGGSSSKLDDFLTMLKSEDAKSKKLLRRFYIFYIVVAIIYFLAFIVNPDPEMTLQARISGTSYVLAFALYIWLLKDKLVKLEKVDYLNSQKQFLIDAKKRFSFWSMRLNWLILFLILIDFGATLSLVKYIHLSNLFVELILIQSGYLLLIAIGFVFGRIEWKKKNQGIYRRIEKMLSEFED